MGTMLYNRLNRGNNGVTNVNRNTSTNSNSNNGWRLALQNLGF